jgi:hypothetical protein
MPIFLSERMLHKDYDHKGSVKRKDPGTKTNWLAVNHQSWSNSDSELVVWQSPADKDMRMEAEDIVGIRYQATTFISQFWEA